MCEEGAVSNQLFTWWHHSYSNNNLKNCGQIILLQANHSNINQRVADEHTELPRYTVSNYQPDEETQTRDNK